MPSNLKERALVVAEERERDAHVEEYILESAWLNSESAMICETVLALADEWEGLFVRLLADALRRRAYHKPLESSAHAQALFQ